MSRSALFSMGYRLFRLALLVWFRFLARIQRKPFDFEDVVLFGDRHLSWMHSDFRYLISWFSVPKGIGAELFELKFPSPITVAAFKGELEIHDFWLSLGAGGVCLKTVMLEAREGNPRPRISEVSVDGFSGIVNALGLPGPGAQGLCESLNGSTLQRYGRPIGISIGGESLEEYGAVFEVLERELPVWVRDNYYYELNLSCPNTDSGQALLERLDLVEAFVREMRGKTRAVIGLKLSPDQSNGELLRFAEMARGVERVFLTLGNTRFRSCETLGLPVGALSRGAGGLSGGAIFNRTLEMVALLGPMGVPIIATGGISEFQQVRAVLESGASLVGMATGVIEDPYRIPCLNRRLRDMREIHI